MSSSDGLVGCPGAGQPPASEAANQRPPTFVEAAPGSAVCSRCGGVYRLRADGRLRAHRVRPDAIVPMIRRGLDPAGRLRGRRA